MFDAIRVLPNPVDQGRYDELLGLGDVKQHLAKQAWLLLNPNLVHDWSERVYGYQVHVASRMPTRSPLFLFAGDVGTGKTQLAETFGNAVALESGTPVVMMKLSLQTRGAGVAGQSTDRIARAFDHVNWEIKPSPTEGAPERCGVLVIDEADALAESRASADTQHEDRAATASLLRGLDELVTSRRPVIVVMCTNRLSAIDPAVQRRAAQVVVFKRPTDAEREDYLLNSLQDVGVTDEQVRQLSLLTGPREGRDYPYSFSDLSRLISEVVLEALPDKRITFKMLVRLASRPPTPPFVDG